MMKHKMLTNHDTGVNKDHGVARMATREKGMEKHTIRRRGFTLFEVMVVLAAIAVVAWIAANFARSMGQTTQREQMIAQHVQELAQVDKAVRTYMTTNKSGWTLGTKVTIPISTLITQGLLPTNFARRRTTDGETPWGQSYAIAAIKESISVNGTNKEVARAVIFETGSSLLSRLKRAGYEDTAEAKLGLKRTVAAKAVEKQKLLAGFVPAGSFVSTGSLSAFSKNLTAWIGPSAPTEAIVVILIGFPDLETDPDNDPNGGGPSGTSYTCNVRPAWYCTFCGGGSFQDGQCDVGYTRIRQLTHCAADGTSFTMPQYNIALTVGRIATISAPSISESDIAQCTAYAGDSACSAAEQQANVTKDVAYTGIVTMNNLTATSYDCGAMSHFWAGPPNGSTNLYGPYGSTVTTSARDALCCLSQ